MEFIWQSAVDFAASHFYLSPFWWWCVVGGAAVAGSTAAAVAINFYLPDTWVAKLVRTLAGVIFAGSIVWLFGYRKGETDAEAHAKAEAERNARKPEKKDWW